MTAVSSKLDENFKIVSKLSSLNVSMQTIKAGRMYLELDNYQHNILGRKQLWILPDMPLSNEDTRMVN